MSQVRRQRREIDGVLLLDKPLNISSNQALQKARWMFNAKKAGHTGVLDPLATGLLPVCMGEATKFSSYLLDADKGYRAHVQFGMVRSTGDLEGEVLKVRPVTFSEADLLEAIKRFTGKIQQIPPMYSALKHNGRPLYEYAREGIVIEREAREITIHQIDLVEYDPVAYTAVMDVRCSKGTYIRTLAEDIGEFLDAGAHLIGLRRIGTAGFSINNALTLDQLEAMSVEERDQHLLPIDVLVQHFSEMVIPESVANKFNHGQAIQMQQSHGIMQRFRIYDESGKFLGLGDVREDRFLHPVRLLSSQ